MSASAAVLCGASVDLAMELANRQAVEGLTIGSAGNFVLEAVRFGPSTSIVKRPLPFEFMIARVGASGRDIVGLLMDGSVIKIDIGGRKTAELRTFSNLRALALSKDAKMLAFCGEYDVRGSAHGHVPFPGDRQYGIATSDTSSNNISAVQSFSSRSEIDGCGDMSWSSSGKNLVYEYGGILYIYDRLSSQTKYLADGTLPAWRPNGNQIAFRNPGGKVQVMDAVTKRTSVLLDRRVLGALRWSPDGKYLAFGEAADGVDYVHSRLLVFRTNDAAVVPVRFSGNSEIGRDEGWMFLKSSDQ